MLSENIARKSMKKTHQLMFACVTFILMGFCAVAHAENRAGAVSLTLGGGYEYFATKRHIQNTGMPLIALGYHLTSQWEIEGLFSVFNTRSKTAHSKQINGNLFAIDGVYHFASYRWIKPYVLAGPGVARLNPNRYEAHSEGYVNGGIGMQVFVDPSVAFRFEVRDLYTLTGGKNDVLLDAGVRFLLDLC
jgi:OmpA-OmpF porin, OOP family